MLFMLKHNNIDSENSVFETTDIFLKIDLFFLKKEEMYSVQTRKAVAKLSLNLYQQY